MHHKGKITSWNDEKGFGFISPSSGGKRLFVHIKAFDNRNRRPEINQFVYYVLSTDNQGRLCATEARLAGDRSIKKGARKSGLLSVIGAILFLGFVAISVLTGKVTVLILAVYCLASLFAFIMYAADKSAAKSGAWRIKESTLHLLSLIGGWPGALVAQQVFRHKTSKASFRTVFWITVFLNCGVFIWLLTPAGASMLKSLLVAI